ncbi:MAG: leucyl/phenylalanyl-tRNA--protein transferase [Thermoguttaceae bacterium]|nr:leucyl/phenylalanyl-tRNA--protein transferase [Thermoguttaceae bacterium]
MECPEKYAAWLVENSTCFPHPSQYSESGHVLYSDSLPVRMLVDGYAHGVFPWPHSARAKLIPWCSPDPRGIFEWDQFHIPRSLRRTIRQNRFEIRFDTAFRQVIQLCGVAHREWEGTWITPRMVQAYTRLHELGFAHSVESWIGNRLVGGIYGVAIRGLFAAESMFYLEPEASKVALVALYERLRAECYRLFDIQMVTENTERFGAVEIPRTEYLRRLHHAVFE